ncbi:hypothetical protein [Citrobacter sp. Cb028]|uniref:hypothetical protein n=1 Tax=Citrobacter sp. Cb028 TaxID=2985024 RepID=UPI0025761CA9|nr:hypothetical protein [Citrobacter sp. Cb028]MDM3455715.1 hypothetical protein [Citrobacter sp. Cb028]
MTTNNHPAHGPVSLQRLHQISEILSKAVAQSDGGNLGYAIADAVKVIAGVLEIPETLPCPVFLEPGLKFGKGVRTQCVLDALRRRSDYYTELESMTPEQRAEHDANIAAFKSMLPKPDIEMLSSALRNAPLAPSDSQGKPREPVVPDECKESPTYVKALTKEGAYIYGFNACRAAMLQAGNSPATPDCWCRTCRPVTMSDMRFVVCPDCGNKRCPHANDHQNACARSNDPGQIGSAYPAAPQQEVKNG